MFAPMMAQGEANDYNTVWQKVKRKKQKASKHTIRKDK